MLENADNGLFALFVAVYRRRDGVWTWSAVLTPYATVIDAAGKSSESHGTSRRSGNRIATTREDAVTKARAWVLRTYMDAAGLAHTAAKDSE